MPTTYITARDTNLGSLDERVRRRQKASMPRRHECRYRTLATWMSIAGRVRSCIARDVLLDARRASGCPASRCSAAPPTESRSSWCGHRLTPPAGRRCSDDLGCLDGSMHCCVKHWSRSAPNPQADTFCLRFDLHLAQREPRPAPAAVRGRCARQRSGSGPSPTRRCSPSRSTLGGRDRPVSWSAENVR